MLITALVSGMVLVTLNNASPLYPLLLTSDWYILGRVSTRVWFVITIIVVFLAGFGADRLLKKKLSKVAIILSILAIGELIALSWLRITRPVPPQEERAPAAVYEFLKSDPGQFRVFCVNRCLSQKDVATYNLETIEGYSTLQQKNYYDYFIQLSQVFWDRYTLSLPPFEIYNFREIQPYSPDIAGYNVKYVISPHLLRDKNLVLRKEVRKYLIYENTIVKSRAYFGNGKAAPIMEYSPNYIKVNTSPHETNQLMVSEIYNTGWTAKLDGEKPVEIKQSTNKLRQVELEKDTKFVEMYYNPKSYQVGKIITLFSLVIILAYFIFLFRLRRKQGPQYSRK